MNQLQAAAPAAQDSGQAKARKAARKKPEWLLVDATTVALEVDGKVVSDPVGFRAREFSATVFAAMARAETIDLWRQVAEGLDFSVLTITAAPMALVASLSQPRGILLDVGGSTTSLTVWQAGRPVAVSSIPIGGSVLTGSLMQKWDLSSEGAERLIRAYASGQLSDGDRNQVLEVMIPALRLWLHETEAALARLRREKPLPERLFLLGGGSGLPEVMEAASALAWSEGLHFERYPLVERLRPTDVAGILNRTDLGRGAGDVSALGLAAWAARQSRPQNRPESILRKLCEGKQSE
jgi:cell division protein FtsA